MSLPLKAKVAIRDSYDKPDSPLQETITKLKDVLGLEFVCEPQWAILLADLEAHYEDKGELVRAVIGCVQVWVQAMTDLLDDAENATWADGVVDKVQESGLRLRLHVQVSGKEPSTSWSDTQHGFILNIPQSSLPRPDQFTPSFKSKLLTCFQEKPTPLALRSSSTAIAGDEPEELLDFEPVPTMSAASQPQKQQQKKNLSEKLPDYRSLPKPSTLLHEPPYHLFLRASGASNNNHLEIQCSHPPTLEFLSDYLGRWTQPASGRAVPVKLENNSANASWGVPFDILTLSTETQYGKYATLSPTVLIGLVEGVLGYEEVYRDASHWQFRRDTVLRK